MPDTITAPVATCPECHGYGSCYVPLHGYETCLLCDGLGVVPRDAPGSTETGDGGPDERITADVPTSGPESTPGALPANPPTRP